MGLSTKQVSGDQGMDWGHTFLQSSAAAVETLKSPPTRRRQPLQQQSEPLKCPRCSSTNTKFCYYNNYNKSQPRHFCKSCKRHWTKGGNLRNVPVGGGRKNKRPKISKPAAAVSPAALRQQDFSSSSCGQKNMSNILYHALIGRSSSPLLQETASSKGIDDISKPFIGSDSATAANSTSLNATAAAPTQIIPNSEFHFSSLSTFDMNNATTSYQPLNAFDHFAGNLDSVEESTITTVNIPGSSSGPWPGPEISSSALELPNYWSWNDIDVFTTGDLSMSWDDEDKAVVKP